MKRITVALLGLILMPAGAFAQAGPVKVGYAVVTLVSPASGDYLVSQTLGLKLASISMQAANMPAAQSTNAVLFVNASERLSRNTGIAFVNPWDADTRITMSMRRDDGLLLASKDILVPPHRQIAQLVTQFFPDRSALGTEFTGTLSITATMPIGMLALRFRGNAFSTEPITRSGATSSMPAFLPGIGGSGAFILPQFVSGGGWGTGVDIINNSDAIMTFRLDVFGQDGTPMAVTLNGRTGSTFLDLTVFPGGVVTIAQRDSNGDTQF